MCRIEWYEARDIAMGRWYRIFVERTGQMNPLLAMPAYSADESSGFSEKCWMVRVSLAGIPDTGSKESMFPGMLYRWCLLCYGYCYLCSRCNSQVITFTGSRTIKSEWLVAVLILLILG